MIKRTLIALLVAVSLIAADWPAFRGPHGNGAGEGRGLPVRWGPKEKMIWKAALPGPGASSPIIWRDRIFVTCYSGYGVPDGKNDDPAKLRRHLLCMDRQTGQIVWQKDVAAKFPEARFSRQIGEHGYATSTPVTDGERVYVFFGRTGVLAFDLDGKPLWQCELGKGINTFGSGSSPVLYKNLVLVNATVEGAGLVALDKATGNLVWQAKPYGDCWSTPILVELPGGKAEVVLNELTEILAYDPEKGNELWKCDCPGSAYASSTPLAHNGLIYAMGAGQGGRWFLAIRAGGRGDVSNTRVVWKQGKAGASYCSPLLVGEHLSYFSALASCLRSDTGAVVFQERLAGLGNEYGSPVVVDGRIYLFTRRKGAYVPGSAGPF